MDLSYIFLIIAIAVLLLIIGGVILYRFVYNRYLNKRLNGETEKRKMFNFPVFLIVSGFSLCAFFIGFLGVSLISARTELEHYRGRLEELYPRQQMMSDDEVISEFSWLVTGMQSSNLAGYTVTKMADGDFECYVAKAKKAVLNNSLLPTCAVYFKFTGGDLIHPSIEMMYTYSYDRYGSSVTFNDQYLFIAKLYSDEEMFSAIDITVKTDPQANKNPEIHSVSHFEF